MAAVTLTKASVTSRRVIRYGFILIIAIILARLTFLSGVNLYERFFPDPPPKPTVNFGKLPKLPFGEVNSAEGLSYTLETVDATLPSFPDQVNVYLMPKPQSSIRALDRAKNIAEELGFSREGRELVETVYVFSKGNQPSTLSMNIVTGIFSISYDVNSNPQLFTTIPPTPDSAVDTLKRLLSRAELLKDLGEGAPYTTQLLRIESGELEDAVSLSEANLIKVNLFRRDYGPEGNKIPSVTPDPSQANVWFLLGGVGAPIIAGEYHYFPIDSSKNSTYPIKTSQEAWEDLKNGEGFIASPGTSGEENITIRNVYMAYYDPGQYVEFYQPVIVFEGEDDFVAYVPAVTDEYYGKEQNRAEDGN